jgi:hypothetical protein
LKGAGSFAFPSINLGSLCRSGHALLGPLVHSLQILFPFGHFGGRHKCNPLLTCGGGWAHLLGVLNGVTTNGVTVGGHHRQGCEVAAVCTAKKILQSDEEGY